MNTLIGYLLSYGYLFLIIFGVGLLKKIFNIPIELSRKIIHILIGFTWLILYRYLFPTVHFIIIPVSFVIINYISYKFHLFKMYERENDEKNHLGTVYYAVAMTIMAIISVINEKMAIPYGLSVFVLSFGDGAAAIFGTAVKKYNYMLTKEKSIVGTLSCIVFSALGIILFCLIFGLTVSPWIVLLLSILSGIFELAGKGLDNFTITFGIMLVSSFLI